MGVSETLVSVHIDRLVLRGIDPLDRQAFVSGMKTELARVLINPETRAAIQRSRITPVMRLGAMPMQKGLVGARALGRGVARAMARGMKS